MVGVCEQPQKQNMPRVRIKVFMREFGMCRMLGGNVDVLGVDRSFVHTPAGSRSFSGEVLPVKFFAVSVLVFAAKLLQPVDGFQVLGMTRLP